MKAWNIRSDILHIFGRILEIDYLTIWPNMISSAPQNIIHIKKPYIYVMAP